MRWIHKTVLSAGVILFVSLITGVVMARKTSNSLPIPKRDKGVSAQEFDQANSLKQNPAVKFRGPAKKRVYVKSRGVKDTEWVAFYAHYNNPIKVQEYIRRGVDVNPGYVPGCGLKGNALFVAVIQDNQTVVKQLLGAGAKLDFKLHGGYTALDWGWVGRTPLQVAKEMNNREMIRILENRVSIRGNMKRVYNPERYVGFETYPSSRKAVRGGYSFDFRTRRYRAYQVCRAKSKYSEERMEYGIIEKNPATGRMDCDFRRYAKDKHSFNGRKGEIEVLVYRRPLRSNQALVWQGMHKESYVPGYKGNDGKYLIRWPVFSGFTLSGIGRHYYGFAMNTEGEAKRGNIYHEILTLVEYN